MRIVLAHEWLTNWAGSEQVVDQMRRISAASQIVASVVDEKLVAERFPGTDVRPLWPSRLPGATEHWARYVAPMMAAWATTKIRADGLLVSSHFAAHAATLRFDGPSIVYYHTPARIVWRPEIELERLPRRVRGPVEHLLLPAMRRWDRTVAQHPTVMLANSSAVAQRIRDAYGRSAEVLHPPVDVVRWQALERRELRHLVWLGRLVAYKRPGLAVEAARISGLPLVIIGDGPERAVLEREAPPNVRFLGHASDEVVRQTLSHASGMVFPGEEDFGIAPVEALAAGVPVVAYAAGGALDYVRHGENGLLVGTQDADAFAKAMVAVHTGEWDPEAIRRTAEPFGPARFEDGLRAVLATTFGTTCRSAPRTAA